MFADALPHPSLQFLSLGDGLGEVVPEKCQSLRSGKGNGRYALFGDQFREIFSVGAFSSDGSMDQGSTAGFCRSSNGISQLVNLLLHTLIHVTG